MSTIQATSRDRKIPLNMDVYDAAVKRISWVFDTFSRVCVSFSGGKDSTLLFHLTAREARKRNRKFSVMFIDWEVQFQYTINHIQAMKSLYADCTETFYWIALPVTTVNGTSACQPEWTAWEPGIEWVRTPPDDAITNPGFFPFYTPGITFEDFVPAFNDWLARVEPITPTAILTGMRADESLMRFQSICDRRKNRYSVDKPWTTSSMTSGACTVSPVYDWRTADVWSWFARTRALCNPLYELMHQAGVKPRYMRICEPFGPEQRAGLWLFHVLEPELWDRICRRVSGAHTGELYAAERNGFYGQGQLVKPQNKTWKEYALFLLDSLPPSTAEHYRNKIAIYLQWYRNRDYPDDIPDCQDKDTGSRDVPSWRRICRTLLRNDYWCRSLSFSPTRTHHYDRWKKRVQEKRKLWQVL
jgi:predicted phosphoadenosine phosphosulfate sulfurtransferase